MIAQAILLGILTVTSYRPVPEQTKPECTGRFHCTTSIDDGITKFGVAVSQDMLKDGRVHYGDVLFVEGYGYRVVNDCMGARHKNAIDLMVLTRDEEKAVGVRHKRVLLIHEPKTLPGVN
jgi:3D (Asp-Asp-Asp) domain-containing protein